MDYETRLPKLKSRKKINKLGLRARRSAIRSQLGVQEQTPASVNIPITRPEPQKDTLKGQSLY